MFDRLFKNPLSTLGGLALGVFSFVSTTPSGFTWRGFAAGLGALILGGASKDK